MINGKTVIAIIPARGGSKRIPGKNLKDLCGQPLIEWTIDAARQSKYIDKIVVTTEDRAIVQAVAHRHVEIVDRPGDMASDQANIYDAIFHALDQYEPYDYTVLLQPTSPLRLSDDIDDCLTACMTRHAPACVSIDETRPVANGAVYVAWTTWLREFRNFDLGRSIVQIIPQDRGVDVDTIDDFKKAEHLMQQRLKRAA